MLTADVVRAGVVTSFHHRARDERTGAGLHNMGADIRCRFGSAEVANTLLWHSCRFAIA